MKSMRCELISWPEVQRLCLQLAKQIKASAFHPEVVVAIGRGGYVPARLLCDYLDIMALTSIKIELYSSSEKMKKALIRYPLCNDIDNQRVLLIDDVNDSGETLKLALAHLQSFRPGDIRTAVLHHKNTSLIPVDYFADRVTSWRWLIYPWAIFEDVSGFLRTMTPVTDNVEQSQQYLIDKFALRISKKKLREIIDLMNA